VSETENENETTETPETPEPEVVEEPVAEAPAAEAPEPAADEPAETEAESTESPEEPEPAAAEAEAPAAPVKKQRPRKHVPRTLRRQRPKPQRERPAQRRPIVRLPKPDGERGRRQERRVVVSSAMDKTIVVKVDMIKIHPRYKKVIRRSKKFHAHDEQNKANVGDVVRIVETRPLSKTKNWRLAEVVEVAK